MRNLSHKEPGCANLHRFTATALRFGLYTWWIIWDELRLEFCHLGSPPSTAKDTSICIVTQMLMLCSLFSVPCLRGWIFHATCHVSQHCQSCATRKCPQTIYFREGSWISAKRCAIKHNESRGADPAPATALTSNSFCHPTFVSFMVSGGNIEVEMWIVDEKWEWCLSNGAAQRWREDRSDNFDHQVCLQYEFLNGGGSWFRWSCSSTQGKMSWIVILSHGWCAPPWFVSPPNDSHLTPLLSGLPNYEENFQYKPFSSRGHKMEATRYGIHCLSYKHTQSVVWVLHFV